MVHIGKVIQGLVEQKGISITAFAKKIGTSRRNVYRIFENPSIDTSLLTQIGEVLGENLFMQYISSIEVSQRYPNMYSTSTPKETKGYLDEIIANPEAHPGPESIEDLKKLHKTLEAWLAREEGTEKPKKKPSKKKRKK